jgi:hypothetical protein
MALKWVPGKPSGPTKQVYYSTAEHPNGTLTLSVTLHSGVKRYHVARGGKFLASGFTDKTLAVEFAERAAEETACQA